MVLLSLIAEYRDQRRMETSNWQQTASKESRPALKRVGGPHRWVKEKAHGSFLAQDHEMGAELRPTIRRNNITYRKDTFLAAHKYPIASH